MTERKNIDYYRKLRKENLSLYLTSRVQREMHAQALKQGARFYETAPQPEVTVSPAFSAMEEVNDGE